MNINDHIFKDLAHKLQPLNAENMHQTSHPKSHNYSNNATTDFVKCILIVMI